MTESAESLPSLTPQQARFVEEYLVDLNATQAAIRAGYSEKTARSIGCENLTKPNIAAAVAAGQAARSARVAITQDDVLRELWGIASADPNDLIQWRIGACLKCWADDEPEAVQESLEAQPHGGALRRAKKPEGAAVRTAEPNPDCAHCGGEGMGRPFVIDTRTLTGPARKLYAGVKVTKDGLEVKMHNKVDALTQVGRHLGMFTDKTEHTGAIGITITPDDANL